MVLPPGELNLILDLSSILKVSWRQLQPFLVVLHDDKQSVTTSNLPDTGFRDHKLKIYEPQVHLDIRKYFFSIRVIEEWNSLPVELINCNTVESFKKRIDWIGDIHKFALSVFPRVSHLCVASWVELSWELFYGCKSTVPVTRVNRYQFKLQCWFNAYCHRCVFKSLRVLQQFVWLVLVSGPCSKFLLRPL